MSKTPEEFAIELDGHFQHLIGPSVHGDGAGEALAVEAAHVALRIVKAHEPVHLRYGGKGVVDRFLQVAASGTGRGNLDKSAQ